MVNPAVCMSVQVSVPEPSERVDRVLNGQTVLSFQTVTSNWILGMVNEEFVRRCGKEWNKEKKKEGKKKKESK